MSDKGSVTSLPSIRRYLVSRVVGVVAVSFVVFSAAAYVFVVRPAQDELARVEMSRAAEEAEGRMRQLIGESEQQLALLYEWVQSGLIRANSTQEIARLLIPTLRQQPQISVIAVADERGRTLLFGSEPDGGWLLRLCDIEKWGARQHWLRLGHDGSFASEEWVERRFDARTRPWFQGAMALASDDDIFWTDPYEHFHRKEAGLTTARRWTSPHGGAKVVVSVDLLLYDLSLHTTRISVGAHGRAAILAMDGSIIGVPRHPGVVTEGDIRVALLKTPREAGFTAIEAALTSWRAAGQPVGKAAFFSDDGETWIARFRELQVRNLPLLVAAVAPRSDFALGTVWDAAAIGALMMAVLAFALLLGRRIAQHFSAAIDSLITESARIGVLQLDAPVRIQTETREIGQLVQAQERMRVMLLDATRGLEAKVAERTGELRAANAEQKAIFESATSGIALLQDRRILRCNRRLEEIFGWGPGELVGQNTRVWYSSDEAFEGAGGRAYEQLSQGKAHGREIQMVRRDGSLFWCRVTGRLVDPAEPARGSVWTLDDATAEHDAADALREAKRVAEEATQAKSMFLASMSHEIRTPMNGVLGLLQLLGFTRLDAEQKATLDGASESARSLLRIINDLLDFSKIEAGRLEMRPEAASIAGLVESVRQVYSGVASAKDLVLRTSIDPAISPALKVDPLRLRQILNNFASNAIKFTEKGSVEIAVALTGRADGCEELRFSVTDTGIGVPSEAQARLFEPYAQASVDTARQFGGTGLGLTICRRLADLMGGAIAMQSEVGKGTTMILTLKLPIADPRDLPGLGPERDAAAALVASRRAAPSVEAARAEGTLVLIAEDHPTNRNLLTRLLALLGYAAETAKDGKEALAKWESGHYGALLTDCNMPEMDGYELARAVRAREAGGSARLPIIACTANAFADETDRCIESGMDDLVAKPVELEALARAMERWLPLPAAGERAAPRPAAAARGAAAPLDRSSLASITGGDAAMEREILADFKTANDADMSALRSALAERDVAKVTHASHRVKGACKMVGALALAGVCERMERAGRRNSWQDVALEQAALEQEFERLNTWLKAG